MTNCHITRTGNLLDWGKQISFLVVTFLFFLRVLTRWHDYMPQATWNPSLQTMEYGRTKQSSAPRKPPSDMSASTKFQFCLDWVLAHCTVSSHTFTAAIWVTSHQVARVCLAWATISSFCKELAGTVSSNHITCCIHAAKGIAVTRGTPVWDGRRLEHHDSYHHNFVLQSKSHIKVVVVIMKKTWKLIQSVY